MVGNYNRLLGNVIIFMLVVSLLPLCSFAASTGQIKGTLTDNETGEPVIGASVMVVGTKFGCQTNLDGYFEILRLEPDKYTIKISSVDYNTVEVTDVEVKIDETFEINQKLTKKVTELDKVITVVGTTDILDKFVTDSRISMSQDAIKSKPVTTVDALLDQVAGVQKNAAGEVFIRGGRAGEVLFIVDGVPLEDPLGGSGGIGASVSLSSGSIQEIQIIKDGFDPEYGNALSGIVNIRSMTGSKDNTRINFQYITDDLGNRDLNKYSRNMDYMRFSVSGPDPFFSNKILPSLKMDLLKDQEFTYYFYADAEKNDGPYQMDDYDSPVTKREWSNLNFLGIDIPERLYNRYSFQTNIKFRPRQSLKFVLSYKKWYIKSTDFQWEYRYSNSTAPIRTSDRSSISLEVNQNVSRNMNYEVVLSLTNNEYNEAPGDANNSGKTLNPDQFLFESQWEDFTDLNNNGIYDAPEPLINLFPDTAVFGTNFTGPLYTNSELFAILDNTQGGGQIEWFDHTFRFNDNGYVDNLEGEPFIDLNGNGVWDRGDALQDRNGNGRLDIDRMSNINQRSPEPYIDGDSVIGEPFTDLNGNNTYDPGIDGFAYALDPDVNQDLNRNGRYDGPLEPWTPGTPYLDRNGNGLYDRPSGFYDPGEPFTDINGNGIWDNGGASNFLNPGNHLLNEYYKVEWLKTHTRTWRGEVKIIRQIKRHELKAGMSLQRTELDYQSIQMPYVQYSGRPDTTAPYYDRGAFRDFYQYDPLRGSVYFRDKIEYGSMIASLGLRWDFFLQDTEQLADVLKADDRGGTILGDRQKFSPRIGFSYPISDKAKVYFNYGHFFQLGSYTLMYARNTAGVNQNDVIGNPNLDYQKTIQYSFGVKYAMSESYALDVEGYFKDEFDKINSGRVEQNSIFRQQYLNKDYGRSRGFEVTLEKRGGGYVNGQVSYAYAFAFGKDSQTNERYLEDFEISREPLTEAPLDNDIRHSFKAGINIYMPTTVKPRLFGFPIPNGWSLAIEAVIESGVPFTPTDAYPFISSNFLETIERNSLRYPGTAVFDARFSKEFKMANLDFQFIIQVDNIFDKRNVLFVYSSTGRADTQNNYDGDQIVKGGLPIDSKPGNWDYGRQIQIGLEVNI